MARTPEGGGPTAPKEPLGSLGEAMKAAEERKNTPEGIREEITRLNKAIERENAKRADKRDVGNIARWKADIEGLNQKLESLTTTPPPTEGGAQSPAAATSHEELVEKIKRHWDSQALLSVANELERYINDIVDPNLLKSARSKLNTLYTKIGEYDERRKAAEEEGRGDIANASGKILKSLQGRFETMEKLADEIVSIYEQVGFSYENGEGIKLTPPEKQADAPAPESVDLGKILRQGMKAGEAASAQETRRGNRAGVAKRWDTAVKDLEARFRELQEEGKYTKERSAREIAEQQIKTLLGQDIFDKVEETITALQEKQEKEEDITEERNALSAWIARVRSFSKPIPSPKDPRQPEQKDSLTKEQQEELGKVQQLKGEIAATYNRIADAYEQKFGADIMEGTNIFGPEFNADFLDKIMSFQTARNQIREEVRNLESAIVENKNGEAHRQVIEKYREELSQIEQAIKSAAATVKPAQSAPESRTTKSGPRIYEEREGWDKYAVASGTSREEIEREMAWKNFEAADKQRRKPEKNDPNPMWPEKGRVGNPTWPSPEANPSAHLDQNRSREEAAQQAYDNSDPATKEYWQREREVYNTLIKNRSEELDQRIEKRGLLSRFRGLVEGYNKLSRGKKLLLGVGIGAMGVGLTLAGGAIAVPALVSGAMAGRLAYSVLGGAATFYGVQKALRERAILKGEEAEKILVRDNYGYEQSSLNAKEKLKLQEAAAQGNLAKINREGKNFDRYIAKGFVSAIAVAIGAGLVGPLVGESLREGGKIAADSEAGKQIISIVGNCYEKVIRGIASTGLEVDAAGGRYPMESAAAGAGLGSYAASGNHTPEDIIRQRPGGSQPADVTPAREMYRPGGAPNAAENKFGGFSSGRDAHLGPFKGSDGNYYDDPRVGGPRPESARVTRGDSNYNPSPESGTSGPAESRNTNYNPYPESGTQGSAETRRAWGGDSFRPEPENMPGGAPFTDLEVEVKPGKGIEQTLRELQKQVGAKYGEGVPRPKNVEEFLKLTPYQMSDRIGALMNGKSFVVHPGDGIGFDENGNLYFERADGSGNIILMDKDGNFGDKLKGSYMETGKKTGPLPNGPKPEAPKGPEVTPPSTPEASIPPIAREPMPVEGNQYFGGASDALEAFKKVGKVDAYTVLEWGRSANPHELRGSSNMYQGFSQGEKVGASTWANTEFERTGVAPLKGEKFGDYIWRVRQAPDQSLLKRIMSTFTTPPRP